MSRCIHFIYLGIFAVFLGCEPRERQFEAEAHTVFGLMRMVESYEIDYPGTRITNLTQVFSGLNRDYPYQWHTRFKPYGKHAGFTNSFFEKYVFFQKGITNSLVGGEILFMNATPYPTAYNEMQRTVVVKASDGYFRVLLLEDRVQLMLKESGIAEPKPLRMPAPPPAPPENNPMTLRTQISRFFMRVAAFIGISQHWLLLRNITFFAFVGAGSALTAYLVLERVRRRK